ncbi:type VI secretion system lipoprotein TssJ [Pseudomonas sp. V98_8]|jgi:type VI secretion system protein VasD|uniref:type VI secretion system lipoprotein TssJ n=1 Tax=Pseudomonas sp. V98_8 TaxID=3044228 RepID=UPI00249E07F3|nr:type VI secretion system lipoprotein TssJ [Pseudomonas sp. V98_8]MDI3395114.1 type VI secretion system lipoprotein TssJ [Pseudomonas sp. V98_8]
MSRTVAKSLGVAAFGVLLSACGVTQSVTDATTSTTEAIFYKQVKTLHLDLSGRAALNTAGIDMNALSVPTLVRVYQLRDRKALEKANYDSLLSQDEHVLSADLLDKRTLVVKPDQGAQLNIPLDKQARYIAVVALFREVDNRADTWRLTLARDDLDPDRVRVIELGDNRLTLRPLAKE